MNHELGDKAILVPKAIPKAIRAFNRRSTTGLEGYLRDNLPDTDQVDRILAIISIGITTISILKGL